MNSTVTASYTKLRSGNWGIRINGAAQAGDRVTVTTKAGATKSETIARVIWAGNGVAICAIIDRARPAARSWGNRGEWTGCSMGCREGEPNPRCRSCCFDEYDL